MPKANNWATRFGRKRRALDFALLREVERQIAADDKQEIYLSRDEKPKVSLEAARLSAAFGRPYTPRSTRTDR